MFLFAVHVYCLFESNVIAGDDFSEFPVRLVFPDFHEFAVVVFVFVTVVFVVVVVIVAVIAEKLMTFVALVRLPPADVVFVIVVAE